MIFDIKELKITKEMYLEAKKVERIWEMSEKNEYFDDLWTKKDRDFRKKYGDYFDTWEIVREYERRETNTDRREECTKNVYEITYIGDTTREWKFFECEYNAEEKLLMVDGVKSFYADKIKKVKCIEYNNNLKYQ